MQGMKDKSVREALPVQPIRESGFSFSLSVGLVMIVSLVLTFIAQACGVDVENQPDWLRYINYLVPQLCFAAAALVWFRRTKESPRELNSFLVELLKKAGYKESGVRLSDTMLRGWYLLPTLLIAAVLPAVFEETVFRGTLALGVKKRGWGTVSAVLTTAALFALMHGSPEQTVYQFACGACFALLAVRSGSVLPGMIAHFVNNVAVVALLSCGVDSFFAALPLAAYIVLVVLAVLVLCGCVLFLALIKREEEKPFAVTEGKKFFLGAAIGIALCALLWIFVLVSGFFGGG